MFYFSSNFLVVKYISASSTLYQVQEGHLYGKGNIHFDVVDNKTDIKISPMQF